MLNREEIYTLNVFAEKIRLCALDAISHIGKGHVGGSLSIAEVLAVLYGRQMQYDAKNPDSETRDWLVVSKGHAGPAVYSALALSGFFPQEKLATLNQGGTRFPSHCDRTRTPGVDMTTGSLGQGASLAAGVAKYFQILGIPNYDYLVLGEGELNEGQVWEMPCLPPTIA